MSSDHTQHQGDFDRGHSQSLSLRNAEPPAKIPGYECRRFLGAGAYGEVWVALDRTTGREVAIKYYLHRGGVDWSLLSSEVEKLAFLAADRYVVQLLDVGWDATPPYFVMEYVEQGSLEERLARGGAMETEEAVTLFRELVVGLQHAHGKGVLHCDLKPANVLLDQDGRPRLADFGQSRLSHEQAPALGTLFYMAPEQADLRALPDARWDVYALGAVLYCMLTGEPPHRTPGAVHQLEQADDLEDRLARYRQLMVRSRRPTGHRKVRGMDRGLAEIVDRCLETDPERRFPSVQSVLEALDERAARRRRWPFMLLGVGGPAVLLAVMSLFAWQWFQTSLGQSAQTLTSRALEALNFTARNVAAVVGSELERRYAAVERIASDPDLVERVNALNEDMTAVNLARQLSDPKLSADDKTALRDEYRDLPAVRAVQLRLDELVSAVQMTEVASFTICDSRGLQAARSPMAETVGMNFSWRSYFNGRADDQPKPWRSGPDDHIAGTHLSAMYLSQANNCWSVAVSAPIWESAVRPRFEGIVSMSFLVGPRLVELSESNTQFPVLINMRESSQKGIFLQHPLFKLQANQKSGTKVSSGEPPNFFAQYRLKTQDLPPAGVGSANYVDPLGKAAEGSEFSQRWLAGQAAVLVRGQNVGWTVLVEESYSGAVTAPLEYLRSRLMSSGLVALVLISVVVLLQWTIARRAWRGPSPRRRDNSSSRADATTLLSPRPRSRT